MLKFFMHTFCGIIKTMDSTYKELSIAIRGYGFFAAVSLTCWFSCRRFEEHESLLMDDALKSFFCSVALQEGLSAGCGPDVHGADPALQDHVPE